MDYAAKVHGTSDRAVVLGTALLAATQLATAAWMVVAPHDFFDTIGPFGAYNGHYLRDTAAFVGGIGLALALAVVRPALRAGALAAAAAMTGLHAVNHWLDVSDAHAGSSAGIVDAVTLTVAFGFAAALTAMATREARA